MNLVLCSVVMNVSAPREGEPQTMAHSLNAVVLELLADNIVTELEASRLWMKPSVREPGSEVRLVRGQLDSAPSYRLGRHRGRLRVRVALCGS